MTENNVALYFLKALKQEGIEHIFLVPGYKIDLFVESYAKADICAVLAAHEGGAAFTEVDLWKYAQLGLKLTIKQLFERLSYYLMLPRIHLSTIG